MDKSKNTYYISNLLNLFFEKRILIVYLFLIILLSFSTLSIIYNDENNNDLGEFEYLIKYYIKNDDSFLSYRLNLGSNSNRNRNTITPGTNNLQIDLQTSDTIFSNESISFDTNYFFVREKLNIMKDSVYSDPILIFIDFYKNYKNKSQFLKKINKEEISTLVTENFLNQTIEYDRSFQYDKFALVTFKTENLQVGLKLVEDYSKYIISLIKEKYIKDLNQVIFNLDKDQEKLSNNSVVEILELAKSEIDFEILRINQGVNIIQFDKENFIVNKMKKRYRLLEVGAASANQYYYPILFTIFFVVLYFVFIIIFYRKKLNNADFR